MNNLDIYKKPADTIVSVAVTRDENNRVQITLAYTTMHAGFFSNLLYGELKIVITDDVAVAATDEYTIFLNLKRFLTEYTVEEQCFIVVHEVMHVIRRDCTMMHVYREVYNAVVATAAGDLPYDSDVANQACDYIINALLKSCNIGQMPKDALYDLTISDGTEDFTIVYARLMQRKKAGQAMQRLAQAQGGGKPGAPGSPGGQPAKGRSVPGKGQFDEHLSPGSASGKKPDEAAADTRPGLQMAVAASVAAAVTRGNMPGALLNAINRIMAPEIPWQDVLRMKLMNITAGGGYNFRSPDRRLITRRPKPFYAPRRSSYNAGTVAVGIDTSGSMSAKMIDVIFFHLERILEDVNPTEVYLLWCDAKLHRVDHVEDLTDLQTARCKGAPGRGGTNLNPILDGIDREGIDPEVLIMFTDLEIGSIRKPDYPVVWAATTDKKEPYGDRVNVKL